MSRMTNLLCRTRSFFQRDSGSATIEFALALPFVMTLFLTSFELGTLLTRNVMLDRGLDMAVRDVRLGLISPLTEETLRDRACEAAVIIPDCENQLRLEMRPLDPRDFSNIPADADCIDRGDPEASLRQFVPGISNQLMIIRACVLFDPMTPGAAFGKMLYDAREDGAYALVSTSAYVVEP